MATAVPVRRHAPARETRPDLRIVGRRRRRPSRGAVLIIAMTVVFCALLASAVFHALLAQGQQQLDRTDRHVNTAQQRYEKLRLQVDDLSSPQRIVSAAQNLGMITPDKVETITPAPGSGAAVPNVPGVDAPPTGDANAGYTAVKPYLGSDQ